MPNIVPISYRILGANLDEDFTNADGHNLLRKCEYIGRISHRSEDRITDYSHMRFIETVVMKHGDLSIIEHASVSVEVEVDRGLTHEIVRHRLAAYTQESTRFVNYTKGEGIRYIQPPFKDSKAAGHLWTFLANLSKSYYNQLIELGEPPELARSVLLTSLAAKLVMTYSLRTWRHFLIMRTSRETHPQMKQLTIPLLMDFKDKIPILFDDIEPEMKQSEAMRLLR